MSQIKIYKDSLTDCTSLPNLFIDTYMGNANDAQIKIYIYLVRVMGANLSTSVSDLADKFNYSEKDVLRALKYWEKNGLLSLDFDENKTLIGIRMEELSKVKQTPVQTAPILSIVPKVSSMVTACEEATASTVPVKPTYTSADLSEFKEREETKMLLGAVEMYLKKTLTPSEMKTILYFSDELHFSDDLIDYLIQYCVEKGKSDIRYAEAVAVKWAEAGITTPRQAKRMANKYDKSVYEIMNALGKTGSPTTKEVEYINRWMKEYLFAPDVILEACERTVLATDKHRFEYAEGILSSWFRAGVRKKADIRSLDEAYAKKKSSMGNAGMKVAANNRFNQYTQNTYDFAALEEELLRL